ncbi:60S ribosomal protein eL38 [Magnusiomyces paraingens]|uniref:Large ribosomal subunit protein eL38 n=1 Tax=Magnusiomyces paraingens TaxID=2606893 RepID=A0A5E8BQU2_9ASCO|nr:uncharacterized protein SAPINGB_P003550 [Saprochaete ingens]VVT53391.1 unnamed protein product [Saprochaete ingens]
MAKQITDIKGFLELARENGTKSVTIKRNPDNTKFKIRSSSYLYTLTVADKEKAEKLIHTLPPNLEQKEIA